LRSNAINTNGKRGLALSGNIEIITRFEPAFRAADQATTDELADPAWSTTTQRPATSRRSPT
jgi:hypothetical protein